MPALGTSKFPRAGRRASTMKDFQIHWKSKFFATKSKPGATNSKSSATKSKFKSLNILRRIEPYQGVTPTPTGFFSVEPLLA
jgi:hypothetical protein